MYAVNAIAAVTRPDSRIEPTNPVQHLKSVHVRHREIAEQDIARIELPRADGLAGRGGGPDLRARQREGGPHDFEAVWIIVDGENPNARPPVTGSTGRARGAAVVAGQVLLPRR